VLGGFDGGAPAHAARGAPRAGRDGAGTGAGLRDLDVVDRLDPVGGRWLRAGGGGGRWSRPPPPPPSY